MTSESAEVLGSAGVLSGKVSWKFEEETEEKNGRKIMSSQYTYIYLTPVNLWLNYLRCESLCVPISIAAVVTLSSPDLAELHTNTHTSAQAWCTHTHKNPHILASSNGFRNVTGSGCGCKKHVPGKCSIPGILYLMNKQTWNYTKSALRNCTDSSRFYLYMQFCFPSKCLQSLFAP